MLKRGFQFAPGYRLQEFLGRGQFGQVWRATAPGGAAMAAKFIDLSDGQGQKEYEGVKRVKQIRHANLMPITAIWLLDAQGQVIVEGPDDANETIDISVPEPEGHSAIIHPLAVDPSWLVVGMLLGGMSLQQRLRECISEGLVGIPPKELIGYLDESAKGIDFLNSPQHDLGEGPIAIQHSDVKPANIVLIGSSAVVCDFGLARILTRNQVTATSAAGTPAYMAPEAISGKPSRNSDQYSLAVTYYHLRCGRLPVNDGSLWEVLDAHRLGKLNLSQVSASEQAVLRKATHLDWTQRFESNVELVDAMRDALRAEGHTRPSFVSSTGKEEARSGSAETDDVDRRSDQQPDPTVTLDLKPDSTVNVTDTLPSQQTLHGSVADASVERSTLKEGFANETLPGLQDDPRGGQSSSLSKDKFDLTWLKRNPKAVSISIGIGCLLLWFGFFAWHQDSGVEREDEISAVASEGGAGESDGRNPPADALPFNEASLLQQAVAMFANDEAKSVELFQQALATAKPPRLESQRISGLQGPVLRMAMTSDGSKLVAMADGPTPLVWDGSDLQAEPIALKGHERLIHQFVLRDVDHRMLSGGSDDTARIWDLRQNNIPASELRLKGHTQPIEAVAWHPTEAIAVTASSDLTLRLWEIQSELGQPNDSVIERAAVPVQENLISLTIDPTGSWLIAITSGDDLVEPQMDLLVYPMKALLEMKGAPEPKRLGGENAKRIACLNHSSDDLFVSGDRGGSLSIYSAKSGELRERLEKSHQSDVEAIKVISVDGKKTDIIVSGAADGTVQWLSHGSPSRSVVRNFCPEFGVSSVDVSSDGRWVAAGCGDGAVWLWDSGGDQDDELVGAYRIETQAASVDSVLIDEPHDRLIAGCADGSIRVWDLTMVKLMLLANPTDSGDSSPHRQLETPRITMR